MPRNRTLEQTYGKWMCDCVIEVASTQGNYQAAMLWEIGKRLDPEAGRPISVDTFLRWRREHPELEEAWQAAQIISQALDEKAMSDFATGKTTKGNATTFALLVNNKYRHEYRHYADNSGNTININNTNNTINLNDLSKDELEYRLSRVSEVLAKAGQGHLLTNQSNENIIDAEVVEVNKEDD